MNHLPEAELIQVWGGPLTTIGLEEGRELASAIGRHTVHNVQPDFDALPDRQPHYSTREILVTASQATAIELPNSAAANGYWRS